MKKKLLLILFLELISMVGIKALANTSDVEVNETNFPDENFRNWILTNIEAARDGVLTVPELEAIDLIACSEKQIYSLKGIEFFTSLIILDCQSNQLTSLDVSSNTSLKSLICYQNRLTSLNLGNITTLTFLSCGKNQLTSLDVSMNTSITRLECQDNQLTSLNIGNITSLLYLDCGLNQLTSLDVSRNTTMELLFCQGNQLKSLYLGNNTTLTGVYCGDNQLTSIDVSMNTALRDLSCYNNKLTTLDISNNTALRSLSFDENEIAFIDVSHAPNLTDLCCMKTRLTSLDVSNNTALRHLTCHVNFLTDLDLRNNTNLTYLRCELNQLYNLDLSNNTLLSSDSEIFPQYADITYYDINGLNVNFLSVFIKALDIPEGIAIPVPSTFDISKVSDLKLDGTAVQGSIAIINGLKFLVFADSGINPSCEMLSYSYDTGNSTIGLMAVNVPITYTGNATVWTDPDTNHTWIYSTSDANVSIDRNAWATGDIVVPSAINGNTVNNIDFKAFYGCRDITSLTIPSTVIHMCDYVINGCTNLQKLIVKATTPPAISDVTFIDYDIPLYVPENAVDTYKNTATWKNFKTIRALSTANQHDLIYKVDGETYKIYTLNEGETIMPEPAPTKEGYTFSGWSEIPQTMPNHDVTITGTFTANKYKLTYQVDGVEYKTYEVEYGASITPEAAPTKEGYSFSGWSEIPETMPAKDVTVTGTFTINKYTLTYMVDGEEYKSFEIEYGASITPEDEPTKVGYTFSGWSDVPTTMPTHDVTVTGTFTINKYKLTYMVDGEEYKSFEIEYGASITPEDEPIKEGYTFSGWSNIPTTMPVHDVTVTGTFTQVVFNIDGVTYEITDNGEVTITGGDEKGEVTIESSVEINGQTYQVTGIADNAFKNNHDITSVTIPEGITTIGDNAFDGCTGLIVINIGKDVHTIGDKAFANVGTAGARTRSEANTIIVNCYAESVPQTASNAFENTPIETGTLFVEDNLKNAFKSTSPWSRFGKIIGFKEAAGINYITIGTEDAWIFDMQGNRLDNTRKGVNIIRTRDGKTKKVMVK